MHVIPASRGPQRRIHISSALSLFLNWAKAIITLAKRRFTLRGISVAFLASSPTPLLFNKKNLIRLIKRGNNKMVYNIKTLGVLTGIVGALAASDAKGATVIVDEPFNNGTSFGLDMYATNDDNGAVYNEGEFKTTSTLAPAIYALGNSTQGSVADMINNEWTRTIQGAPSGEVSSGWSASGDNSGSITVSNNGVIPDLSYTTWQNTNSNSGQDTMALRLGINNDLLESNSMAGYQPFTYEQAAAGIATPGIFDFVIARSDSDFFSLPNYTGPVPAGTIADAFVGYDESGFNSAAAVGNQYSLVDPSHFAVPEPSTSGLLALTLAGGLLGYRNRKE